MIARPSWAAISNLLVGLIVPIPIREPIEPLQISLMSRAGHPLTPAAEALANAIRRRAVGLVRGNNQN